MTRAWGFKKNLSKQDKAALIKARDTVETFTLTDKITQSIGHNPWSQTRAQKERARAKEQESETRKRSRTEEPQRGNTVSRPVGSTAKSMRLSNLKADEDAKMAALKAQFGLSQGKKITIAERR